MSRNEEADRPALWRGFLFAASLPILIILCSTLWHAPYPLSEAVALFEDVAERPASSFLLPSSSYYRPIFHLTLSALWHGGGSTADALGAIRLLHILPLSLLVVCFIWQIRPKRSIDAAAATVAVAVLLGAPGLLGNLELPLSYTIVGMPAALLVWMLLERDHRTWHGPAVVALMLLAIGFKEQGLVIAPVVIAAWWLKAPGAGRGTATTVAAIAIVYVVFRLTQNGASTPPFEQDLGLGFDVLSANDAAERFGAFPLWIYAYNAGSTIANVLAAEPSDGVFRIVRGFATGETRPWHVVYLVSSIGLTGLIAWWALAAPRRAADGRWSAETRLVIVLVVVLAACGVLSFNYSRDRLGGMAVPFYALAAYYAVRFAALRAAAASKRTAAIGMVALVILAAGWQCRAIYTLEYTRQRAVNSHREWLTDLGRRRLEFAGRPEYLRIMNDMTAQGTAPGADHRIRYPRWIRRLMGEL